MNIEWTERYSRMKALLMEIVPLQRMINSPGLDAAFDIIKREIPSVTIHEYEAGSKCGDWVVPHSWHVTEGIMKDSCGKILASIEQSPLFVAPYSEPVDGWFTKEEIECHLRTRPDQPDAFVLEHRNAYDFRLVDWGITLPHNLWSDLPHGKYYIKISVERKAAPMKLAECFLKGSRSEIICICAHIDELCNDDLSGCVVAMELMRSIEDLDKRKYSYQMLLVPEMLGPIFFMNENPEKVQNTIGMLNLETVGAGLEWCLKKSIQEGCRFENVLRGAIGETGVPFREIDFFDGYGNDERVFSWPTFGIPGVALQRFPFAEYHTSNDTLEIIEEQYLNEALKICENFISIMENDYIPEYTNLFQPWLTKRDLYYDSIDNPGKNHKLNNLVLFNVNGTNSVLDLARIADLSFFEVQQYLERFAEQNLMRRRHIIWPKDKDEIRKN